MKLRLLHLFLVSFFFTPGHLFNLKAQVNASFSLSDSSGCAPLSVTFTNTSTGATSYSWDLGNGNTSVIASPGATYSNAGVYTVILTAISGGVTDSDTSTITVFQNPTPAFSTSSLPTCVGQNVLFTDNSIAGSGTIATRSWDFGDGSSQSTTSDTISHSFLNGGNFPVTLIVTNSNGCSKNIVISVEILDGPLADFIGSPSSACVAPQSVAFTNTSTTSGAVTYNWGFGDGTTSTLASPSHIYNVAGNFSVSLEVIQVGCRDTMIKLNYIVIQDIVPDFEANDSSVCAGEVVSFSDLSIPLTTSRTWDFGDGTTSTDPNPNHVYATSGTYTVSLLNATANGCSHSLVKNDFIEVLPNSIMSFASDQQLGCSSPFNVNFTDNSTNAVAWFWDFGDGDTSLVKNPAHVFSNPGTYDVTLTVTSSDGCQTTLVKSNEITISSPNALFAADTLEGCLPLAVVFTDSSTASFDPIVNYSWDFGNGTSSGAASSVNNTYSVEGYYTVKLTVTTNLGCSDSLTKVNYIRTGAPPIANFSVPDSVDCHGEKSEFTDLSIGADSVFWEFGDEKTFSTPYGAVIPYNPVEHELEGLGVFYAKQTAFNKGCPDTFRIDNAITILPPDPNITFNLNCTNPYSVDFFTNPLFADSIVWDFLDGSPLVINDTAVNHVYSTSGDHRVILTAFNFSNGCVDGNHQDFVIANPAAMMSLSPDSGCYELNVQFTNLSIDDDAHDWSFGDGSVNNSTDTLDFNHIYKLPGRYKVTLSIVDVNGCVDTAEKEVIVFGPRPNFVANKIKGCTPLSVDFTDISVSDSAIVEWNWDFGDGSPVETVYSSPINHVYLASGIYTVKMTVEDENACVKSTTRTDYIEVTYPTAEFMVDSFACALEAVFIDGAATQVEEPGTFDWDFGDGAIGIGTSPTHFYSTDSLYTIGLVVTDKNGCADSLQKQIRIQTPVSSFTYSVISQGCGVSDIQFTDLSTGLNITTWKWTFGDGASSPQVNPTHVYTKPGLFPVSLEVINAAGCADTFTIDSILVLGPIGTFSFNPDRGCIPLEVTFTSESDNTINYIWDFGDGAVVSSTNSIVQHVYTLPDTATPNLLLENFLPDGSSCKIPAPSAGFIIATTMVVATIDSVINESCFGDSIASIFSSVTGGTKPYSYLWSSSPSQTTATAVNLGAGSYTIMVTDSNFCFTTASAIITEPSQVITSAGLNDTVCPGDSATLFASAIGGAGNFTYTWQPLGIVNAGLLNLNPSTDSVFFVTASDSINCVGTTDTISAIVYKLDIDSIQAFATSPICPGESSAISVQVDGVTGNLSYQWNNGLGNGPGVYQVIPLAPTTYIVEVTNHCGDVIWDSAAVLFNPPPTIFISADTNAICVAAFLQFYDSSLTGNPSDPIVSWLWNFGDGTTSAEKDPNHHYTVGGTLPVVLTVTTLGGCTNNNSASPLIINTHQYPIANFSVNSTQLDLPYDEIVTKNQSYGAATYFWDFGDGFQSQEFSPSHLYKSVSKFKIQLIATSDFGCPDTTFISVNAVANVVFPNVFTPNVNAANGGLYHLNNLDNDVFFPYTSGVVDYELKIFNRWGELIFESLDINIGWDGYYGGMLCEQDVYIWKAYVKLNDGKVFNIAGDVTLLR